MGRQFVKEGTKERNAGANNLAIIGSAQLYTVNLNYQFVQHPFILKT